MTPKPSHFEDLEQIGTVWAALSGVSGITLWPSLIRTRIPQLGDLAATR